MPLAKHSLFLEKCFVELSVAVRIRRNSSTHCGDQQPVKGDRRIELTQIIG
jgi:hypothetical protein